MGLASSFLQRLTDDARVRERLVVHAELVAHPSETDLRTTILREHLLERTRTARVLGEEQSKFN